LQILRSGSPCNQRLQQTIVQIWIESRESFKEMQNFIELLDFLIFFKINDIARRTFADFNLTFHPVLTENKFGPQP